MASTRVLPRIGALAHIGSLAVSVRVLVLSASIFLVAQAAIASENRCPQLVESPEAAASWKIIDEDWEYVAQYITDQEDEKAFNFALDMDGPSQPLVLDWIKPERYQGKIGLLHYFSGATGTHVSAEVTRYAIVDVQQGRLLELIQASAQLAGSIYTENEDGSYVERIIDECVLTELEWFDRYMEYGDEGYRLRIDLFDDAQRQN